MKFLYFFSVISCSAGEGGSEKSLAASSREGNRGRSSPHADSGRGSGVGVSVPGCGSPGTAQKGASLGSSCCWQSPAAPCQPLLLSPSLARPAGRAQSRKGQLGASSKPPRDWERALPYLPAGQEVLVNVLAFSFREPWIVTVPRGGKAHEALGPRLNTRLHCTAGHGCWRGLGLLGWGRTWWGRGGGRDDASAAAGLSGTLTLNLQ